MTLNKTLEKTRAMSVRANRSEALLILGGLVLVLVLVAGLLIHYSRQLQIQPTPEQEDALYQEANRRLNRDGLVQEYQKGWRNQ